MGDRVELTPPRGFIGLLAAAVGELANGIDLAAGAETELAKKIRRGAEKAQSVDEFIQDAKSSYDQSATKQVLDAAAERKKRIAKEHGTRRSLLRSEKIVGKRTEKQ
jgi:hypothetical protein